jgi:hypothetical protein
VINVITEPIIIDASFAVGLEPMMLIIVENVYNYKKIGMDVLKLSI